ncbi:MAG: sialidase family protein [Nitrososphaeraceae archaeon]|nr:sialidase family protein [Nitrososphaeraceae archaeon]
MFKKVLNSELYLGNYQLIFSFLFFILIASFFINFDTFSAQGQTDKKISIMTNEEINTSTSIVGKLIPPTNNLTVLNLTDNKNDSVYGQIAALENEVYVVWQESVKEKPINREYDIYFIKSTDRGKTFTDPINLSNTSGFSEHPQISVSDKGIFIIWVDNNGSNNTEIMFTRSLDKGKSFTEPSNLSNTLTNSNNAEISTFGNKVYVVWQEVEINNLHKGKNKISEKKDNGNILFRASLDEGNTFKDTIELMNNTNDSFPKINSYNDYVYVVWNSEPKIGNKASNIDEGLFFAKSQDNGKTFGNITRLASENFGEAQISTFDKHVFIVWSGSQFSNINNIYFVNSNNYGNSFTNPTSIFENLTNFKDMTQSDLRFVTHPSNVEVANNDKFFVVWQNSINPQNEDIFLDTNVLNNSTFGNIINLSNNSGISECPSIAISDQDIFVIWEDFSPGNHEIFFTSIPKNNK